MRGCCRKLVSAKPASGMLMLSRRPCPYMHTCQEAVDLNSTGCVVTVWASPVGSRPRCNGSHTSGRERCSRKAHASSLLGAQLQRPTHMPACMPADAHAPHFPPLDPSGTSLQHLHQHSAAAPDLLIGLVAGAGSPPSQQQQAQQGAGHAWMRSQAHPPPLHEKHVSSVRRHQRLSALSLQEGAGASAEELAQQVCAAALAQTCSHWHCLVCGL